MAIAAVSITTIIMRRIMEYEEQDWEAIKAKRKPHPFKLSSNRYAKSKYYRKLIHLIKKEIIKYEK